MSAPMRSVDFRAIVEPILNEVFDGVYNLRADEWKGFMDERTSIPRAYHEEPVLFGLGSAPEMPEGTPVTYSRGGTLFIQRYVHKVFGLAFALSQVLVEDGDHIRIGSVYSRFLAQAMQDTKETNAANILNRAFNGSYVGGDGQSLISTAHPIIGGSFSNQLTVAAALSQTSVEQLLIQIRRAVSNEGKRIRLMPKKLVIPPDLIFAAEVILKSVLRSGNANNDINPVKSMGLLSEDPAVVSRMTSQTAWFIKTDAPEGLKMMMRRKLQRSMEGDFDTDSMRYKATERYIPGWTDPRALWGTAGL